MLLIVENYQPIHSRKLGDVMLPIKMWLDNVEDSALEQINNMANLPFAFHHVAIMPDCHTGYGMPIGGVLATKNVVVPSAVGVDIGCGMLVAKTTLPNKWADNKERLNKIIEEIKILIPLGTNHHKLPKDIKGFDRPTRNSICAMEFNSAEYQLGTLGGGNHFIEFQKGSDGFIYIMIHSGSRNIGYKVANHYNKLAVERNKSWFSSVPKESQLAFLPIDSSEGGNYIDEMSWCIKFASQSRYHMMNTILGIAMFKFPREDFEYEYYETKHNYARLEHHYGKNVMIHRKGAIHAKKGKLCIIPGSQGTSSYIVEGLGNRESFESASHGAGRTMSRTKAKEVLNLEEQQARMSGIVHGMTSKNKLDESPGAYKDIDEVMEQQKDLVKILVKLTPVAVIKG